MKTQFKLILVFLLVLTIIPFISAFQVEKHLIQTEVDSNYPCHIENSDTIVCPVIDSKIYDNWVSNMTKIVEDKGLIGRAIDEVNSWFTGDVTDADRLNLLKDNKIPYKNDKIEKNIDMNKEYRQKIDVYSMSDNEIKIGFGTNTFAVLGTPLENFDINATVGMVRYRPLNISWLYIDGGNSDYVEIENDDILRNYSSSTLNTTISLWVDLSDLTDDAKFFCLGGNTTYASSRFCVGTNASGNFYGSEGESTSSRGWASNVTLSSDFQHVVFIKNGSNNVFIYVDGVQTLVTDMGLDTSHSDSFQRAFFGCGSSCSNNLNGLLDEFRFYSSMLNSSEVSSLYNLGRKQNVSPLGTDNDLNQIAYFPFGHTLGQNIFSSYEGLTGTNTGVSLQSDNINVSTLGYQVNISIVNITSAKIVWDNGTIWNNTDTAVNNFTGNTTFSFLNNQTIYIYENYYGGGESDLVYPIFYNDVISNNIFYININNTNGTTVLNFNGTLYTGSNTSNLFYYNLGNFKNGNYKYNWTSYGNGTSHNLNTSNTIDLVHTNSIYPTFDNLRNFNQLVNTSFSESITATGDPAISVYSLNDTSVFNISNSGLIINVTNLSSINRYYLNISVNDTIGNLVSGEFYIDVTTTIIPISNSSINEICNAGGITLLGAVSLVGIILTITLIGFVLVILVSIFSGRLDINKIGDYINYQTILSSVMIIGLTGLLLITVAYIFSSAICSLGG